LSRFETVFCKETPKRLISKTFVIESLNKVSKSFLIQKTQISILEKGLKSWFKFENMIWFESKFLESNSKNLKSKLPYSLSYFGLKSFSGTSPPRGFFYLFIYLFRSIKPLYGHSAQSGPTSVVPDLSLPSESSRRHRLSVSPCHTMPLQPLPPERLCRLTFLS
jgi:hypothetical protein